jgi:hypothetical protein
VEFYDASASTAVSWRIYVYRPGIYIAIGTTIVVSRPAAQPQPHATEVSPWLLAWLTGEGTRVIQLAMFSLLSKKSVDPGGRAGFGQRTLCKPGNERH